MGFNSGFKGLITQSRLLEKIKEDLLVKKLPSILRDSNFLSTFSATRHLRTFLQQYIIQYQEHLY